MRGERGEDHQFSQAVLDGVLRNNLYRLKDTPKEQEIRWVVSKKQDGRKLRVVIDHFPQSSSDEKLHFNIITGYFVRT